MRALYTLAWVLLGGLVCLAVYVGLVWAVVRGTWAVEDRARRLNRERVRR